MKTKNSPLPVESAGKDLTIRHGSMGPVRLRSLGFRAMDDQNGGVIPSFAWRGGGLVVMLSRDDTRHGPLYHMSISHKHRYPTWDEIAAARYAILPATIDMMMVLPQASDYVAIHPNCFHLWETPAEWGIQ